MTYKQLLNSLRYMSEARLNDHVTVYDHGTGEYMGVDRLLIAGQEQDVLDEGHIYLTMNSNIVVIE